ncbi:FecCD family ABC transporter permease [Curvivirga sp.]|uniref:FecCD family ABC transporter permease n=1 Tax=Curvivirga sp. TaxID=2856848 RepID=UPI003B5C8B8E
MRTRLVTIGLPHVNFRMPVMLFFAVILVTTMLVSLSIGAIKIPLVHILTWDLSDLHETVLTQIRLPRVLLGLVVGGALAVSGAVMQALFRNPLADPGLIGVTSGAALMVAFTIVVVGSLPGILGVYSLSFAAFSGAIITSILIFKIAGHSGKFSVTYLLLAGIAINALAVAGIGFLTYLSDDQQLRNFTFWTLGSLGGALWPAVMAAASVIIPALLILIRHARKLNILLLGESEAQNLGIDTESLKRMTIVVAAISVGAAVAVSGMIGFVGLLVPHLIRLMFTSDNRQLIPLAAMMGGFLLILADLLARVIVTPAEMPVGILTSILGGPFFLWLLLKQFSGRFGI